MLLEVLFNTFRIDPLGVCSFDRRTFADGLSLPFGSLFLALFPKKFLTFPIPDSPGFFPYRLADATMRSKTSS